MAHADRIAVECETLAAQSADEQLAALADRESQARMKSEELADTLAHALDVVQSLRSEQLAVEARLESARADRERTRAELMSLEALQKAALSHEAGRAAEWLAGRGLAGNTRVGADAGSGVRLGTRGRDGARRLPRSGLRGSAGRCGRRAGWLQ